jgi:hypothetical protein
LSTKLEGEPAGACASLSSLVDRVVLLDTGLELSLRLDKLLPESSRLGALAPMKITRPVPMRLKRRGVEMRLVIEGESAQVRPTDLALLKAVARGHRWFKDLASGAAADTLEIARRENVPDKYLRHLIPLAFLSPSLVDAICSDRHPATLTAEKLKRTANLPCEWRKQHELFAAF